jgi:hypothetical protein
MLDVHHHLLCQDLRVLEHLLGGHLQDIGTKIAQQGGAERSGQDACQVEDPDFAPSFLTGE